MLGYVSQSRRIFRAESLPLGGARLDRRGLIAAACGCCATALLPSWVLAGTEPAPSRPIHGLLDEASSAIEARMVAWRRDIHAHPELGNQEHRTSALVAAHLRQLGYEVRDEIAVTGVVGVLTGGGGAGPTIALRADMDALPVAEEIPSPFASRAKAQWDGAEVPVMHACGHDCHTAILM